LNYKGTVPYIVVAILCVLLRLATESVRWLLTKGRLEEARDIILKAATTNGVELSQESLNKIEFSAETRDKTVS
jgi:Tfp pilus assembly protein PilE